MEKINNVGIMGNAFRVMAGLDSVYGYDIAVNDNMNALIKYGSLKKMTYFYEPLQFQESIVKRKYRTLERKKLSKIKLELVSEYDLINKKNFPQIDVLHNFGMEFMPQIYYRDVIAPNPFPVTYMIHGASYPYYIDSFYLMKLIMPFKPYDSLICTSKAVQSAIKKTLTSIQEYLEISGQAKLKYEGRLDVLPLGIDTEFFKPMNKKEAKEEYSIPMDTFVLLWIGRFSAYDKADLLPIITAYKRIITNNPDKKLLLVIAGYDRKNMQFLPVIEKYARDLGIYKYIMFLGEHDLTRRQYLYSAADVFISPIDNVQETFGLTPIEAMACGIPQIVSDWDGYRDTVVDGVTGFRIPTYWTKCDEDISEAGLLPSEPMHRSALHHLMMAQSVAIDLRIFVEDVQKLIDNPSLWEKMSRDSVRIAKEKFGWKNLIPRYEELWEELMDRCKFYSAKNDNRKKIEFIRPRYCDYFADYPTRFISRNERMAITQEGIMLSEGKFPIPKHYEVEDVLSEIDIALEILLLLKVNTNRMISDIHIAMNQYSESKIARAYMWLLKQGFAILYEE